MLSIPHGSATVVVVPWGGEHHVPVTGLRVVGPDPARQHSGPELWWVEVSGTDALCCATPMPLVDVDPSIAPAPRLVTLTVRSAAQDPCDCAGRPIPFTAWHSLGELASGSYTLTANGVSTTFTVP